MKRSLLLLPLFAAVALAGCLPATPSSQPSQAAPGGTTQVPVPAPPATRPFRATSSWNSPLPATTTWRDEPKLRADHWWVNRESYSFPTVWSSPSDPLVAVAANASWGWPDATLALHIPTSATGALGADGSLVVVDGGTVYSFWQFARRDATHATAAAYGRANLTTDTGWGSATPFRGAGIRAAGSSSLAGLITGRDLDGSVIPHALGISMPGSLLATGFVAPAISGDGAGGGSIPEGSRIGIPAGTPRPAGLSPVGITVWNTLVTYGAFVVDQHGGSSPVILSVDPLSVSPGPVETLRVWWNGGPSDLDRIMPHVRVAR